MKGSKGKISSIPRVTFWISARGPAALSSKEQPLSSNSRFWRESPGPRALPESVNPFNAKNDRLTKFSKHKIYSYKIYKIIIIFINRNVMKILRRWSIRSDRRWYCCWSCVWSYHSLFLKKISADNRLKFFFRKSAPGSVLQKEEWIFSQKINCQGAF